MSATNTNVVPMPGFTYVLRIIVLVLSLIILGLASNTLAVMHKLYTGYEYEYSYDIPGAIKNSSMALVVFVAVFSILGNLYIIITAQFVTIAYNMWAQLVFEILSWIFWLSAFAAAGATTAASALAYVGSIGMSYTAWVTAAASSGLGAIVWILHLVIGIVFCVKLHRHSTGAAEKHEMGNIAPQPQQQYSQQPYPQQLQPQQLQPQQLQPQQLQPQQLQPQQLQPQQLQPQQLQPQQLQPQQVQVQPQFAQQTYPMPAQTPGPYVASPPPPQWQQGPPPPNPQGEKS